MLENVNLPHKIFFRITNFFYTLKVCADNFYTKSAFMHAESILKCLQDYEANILKNFAEKTP